MHLQPGETRQIVFVLGYHENPVDQKFDPPGSQTINKRTVKPVIDRCLDVGNVADAFDALGERWEQSAGPICRSRRPTSTPIAWSTSGTPTSAW